MSIVEGTLMGLYHGLCRQGLVVLLLGKRLGTHAPQACVIRLSKHMMRLKGRWLDCSLGHIGARTAAGPYVVPVARGITALRICE